MDQTHDSVNLDKIAFMRYTVVTKTYRTQFLFYNFFCDMLYCIHKIYRLNSGGHIQMTKLMKLIPYIVLVLLISCIISTSIYAQDEHTVLLYTFETGEGDTVKDHSGNNNDGKLMGTKWEKGKFGDGLAFGGNGPRDFIEVPDSDTLDVVDGLTVEMWVFLNSASTAGGTGATKENSYKLGPRSDRKVLLRMTTAVQAWGAAVVISNTALSLNKWIHTAATYDAESGAGKVYIDGELDNEGEIGGAIRTNNDVLWIGRGAGPFLDGLIDEVRISNIARTQKEVQDLMKLGIAGVLSVSPQDKLTTTWGKLKDDFAK